MRELKFRAWDKAIKMMIYDPTIAESAVDGLAHTYLNDWLKDNELYDFTQFTGLKDKNGKEIYEGDIIAWHNRYFELHNPKRENIGQIKFNDGHFSIYTLTGEWDNSDWVGAIVDIEVIGNIYENKDLLK